jgi:enamine deaminase RidA (YjgF/YER057c/UK114 family)
LHQGNKTVVHDWQETGFHGRTPAEALSYAKQPNTIARSKLGQNSLDALQQKSAIGRRAQQVNVTAKKLEAMTLGGLKQQFQGKYVESLKKARLYTAAQTGKAPQEKIDAIVQSLKKQYETTLAKAQRVLKKATKRHARLSKQYYGPVRASQ